MNEKTRYKLHRILDLAMDASEQGDIAINICCCADGAASVFTTICDGEYKKDAQMETMSAYIDKPHVHHGYYHKENDGKKGATNLSTKEEAMVERVKKIWYNYLKHK